MTKTFVIAELACTWEGSIERAKELIEACAKAGADAIKFQWCSNPAKMAARRNMDSLNAYDALAWPEGLHGIFADLCADAGVEYMCTVYLPDDITVIAPFVQRFKVASLEAQDEVFVNTHVAYGKPVYISMGCMDQDTYNRLWHRYGKGVYLLHCVAAYPAKIADLNLRCIKDDYVGFSDHTADDLTGALAVMAGAKVIEVHVRHFETSNHNPDFPHSLTTFGLEEYIANIRYAEAALGDGIKTIQPSEEPLVKHVVKG